MVGWSLVMVPMVVVFAWSRMLGLAILASAAPHSYIVALLDDSVLTCVSWDNAGHLQKAHEGEQ